MSIFIPFNIGCLRRMRILVASICFLAVVGPALAQGLQTAQDARDADQPNEFYLAASAARAATDKVIARFSADYLFNGKVAVYNNLLNYQQVVPKAADSPYWTNQVFMQPFTGTAGTWVGRVTPMRYTIFTGQYQGLFGYSATYRFASAAKLRNSPSGTTAAFWQDVALDVLTIFEFAVFYTLTSKWNQARP
jgi:hypothetical protein